MPFVRYEGRWDSGGPVGAELRVEGKAPVDEDSLPRDVGGLIGAEVGGQPCHLLRGAGAPHRDMTLHHRPCLGVIDPGPIDGGDGSARSDSVYADAVRGILEGEGPGQVLHSALACRIADKAGLWNDLVYAGDIDDHSGLFPLAQVGEGALRAVKGSNQVGGEDGFKIGAGGLMGWAFGLPGSVIDEDIDSPQFPEELIKHGIHGVLRGEIGLDQDRRVPGISLENALLGVSCTLKTPTVVDPHPGSLSRQANGDCLANA